jgi:hypothetical protein
MVFTLLQTNGFIIPSITIWVLAWIFLIIGIIALVVFILYTKYGRELSIKLTVISIALTSVSLGFAIHFFLLTAGF